MRAVGGRHKAREWRVMKAQQDGGRAVEVRGEEVAYQEVSIRDVELPENVGRVDEESPPPTLPPYS